jgi:hypothetical protein
VELQTGLPRVETKKNSVMAAIALEVIQIGKQLKQIYDQIKKEEAACLDLADKCLEISSEIEKLLSTVQGQRRLHGNHALRRLRKILQESFKQCELYVGKSRVQRASMTSFGPQDFEKRNALLKEAWREFTENVILDTHAMVAVMLQYICVKNQDPTSAALEEECRKFMVNKSAEIAFSASEITSSLSDVDLMFRGTFGTIHALKHDGRDAVLKQFTDVSRFTPEMISKVDQELFQAQFATSPNIASVLETSPTEGVIIVERAFCTLADVLYGGVSLPNNDMLNAFPSQCNCFRDISNGIRFLHSLRYVHKGIKSKNVLFFLSSPLDNACDGSSSRRSWVAKISNVGVSTDSGYPVCASTVAWDGYAAPELLRDDAVVAASLSSDIYSWGVTMNEVLMRQRPLGDFSKEEIAHKVNRLSERPLLYNPTDSDILMQKLMRMIGSSLSGCLHQAPSKRPTAEEIYSELTGFEAFVQDPAAGEGNSGADRTKVITRALKAVSTRNKEEIAEVRDRLALS